MIRRLVLLTLVSTLGCAASHDEPDTTVEDDAAYSAESVDSMREVLLLAHAAGVSCANLPMAGAIARAESGLNTSAKGTNPPTSGCPSGSVDRGLWQINSCYHRDVSEACAYDGACNARAMVAISSGGTNWGPWSTFHNGAYKAYLATAKAAYASGIPGCTGGGGSSPPPSSAGSGSCTSGTLGKVVAAQTCVESKFDGAWYTCVGGSWRAGQGVGGSCSATYPLASSSGAQCYSNTLGRNEPAHTCVQSRSDSEWYTCLDGAWRFGKGVGGSCASVHPL